MTDTYGSEPQDHENGAPQENDAVRELPSEDEFSPEGQSAEEQKPSQNRRSPALPIAAAVGGVFLLGVVAWWQFGENSSIQGFNADSLSLAPPTIAEPPAPAAPQDTQPAPKTNLLVPQGESDVLAPPPPAPLESAAPLTSAPVVTITPMGTTGTTAPTGPSIPVPVAPGSVEAAPLVPQTPEQRIEELTNRINSLQKTVDVLTGTSSSTGEVTVPSNKELLDKIDKLEQKLTTANRNGSARTANTASDSRQTSKPKLERPARKKTHSGLVLRAASNGQAWVSTSVNSSDLKEVQVGDKLPGIGRVTDIKMQGEKWVIQGTSGTLQ